ncbi:MAG: protein kinase [Acidobacteria bacterium]|nr:protein kinase [Acidobacteriota bacterium]
MIGRTLAHYEVLEKIGAGGMGEVYRARDTKLGRDVAIKILPQAFAQDSERLARFEREARMLASLNHPNIAAIYGLEEADGLRFLVLELVPGETLAERLAAGRPGIKEVLQICHQMVEALEEAHGKGIVHRDLKPANVKITPEGKVKVLDFGLAKAFSEDPAATDPARSPTVTVGATREGVILGTAAYMSPEQARGKALDKRTDIWSFGCVLYEMLAGRQAFGGESISDSMAAILRGEPDWSKFPAGTPSSVQTMLRRCLQKEPKQRLHDIADARIEIEEALAAPAVTASPRPPLSPSRRLLIAVVLILPVAFAGGMWWHGLRTPPAIQWSGELLGGSTIAMAPRISPDGQLHRSVEVPRGIFSVPVLGGEERLVLEDAQNPQALPDGSLLIARINPERKMQLYRFWPETGRLEALGALLFQGPTNVAVRPFPDGKDAVFFGKLLQAQSDSLDHLYAIDLASGRTRRLAPGLSIALPSAAFPLAVESRGPSVLIDLPAGSLHRIVAIPRDGSDSVRTLITLTIAPWYMDTGPDGSLYLDQVDRTAEFLRFSVSGGVPERVASSATGGDLALPLPDGRVLLLSRPAGRERLLVVMPGKDPIPFLDTSEETALPGSLVGDREVAFLIGPPADRTIAIASIADGRIVRRLKGPKSGTIESLAASPDGKTLYYAAAGTIWAIPSTGGEPRKMHAGDSVAVDPRGQGLIIKLNEEDGVRLVRVPVGGGPEKAIPFHSEFRLTPPPLAPNAVGKDGRIVVQVASKDSWFWSSAVLNPQTGNVQRVPLAYEGDFPSPGWAPDGRIVSMALPLRASIWRFRSAGASTKP